ncbi:Ig-like domain-containing protein [Bifidobacterium olomucense]|uniref:Bacterial Ig-like domain (Group 4) n=1 Tax=Bifidobacterium olomucense TaxID=2675324 RepID=A0A7Y0EXZ2_9BIFI|nr:Ig-like domain-containing protein [Bifidobacterium sp. DSM 109959]NMM98465.1 Bacterial Ig-like domain (group 4) [Bifidobacterium sp. DSM 109959]
MSKNITRRLAGIAAAVASLAMLFCVLPAQAADASLSTDAGANANVVQALKYVQDLNALRARTDRRALTKEQIAAAQKADNNSSMTASQIPDGVADGSAVSALKVNSDVMKWAQTRAEEMAQRAVSNPQTPLSHDNMTNGRPSWFGNYSNPMGTYYFGPEALAIGFLGYNSYNPVDSWYSELNYEIEHPNASADDLAYYRQGYGHYLTEVFPYADIAGIGVSVVPSGRWKGAIVTVLEIAQSNGNTTGTTQTPEEALAGLRSIQSVTNPAAITVESGTAKPTNLPATVSVTYDDGTAGQAAVTWNVPDNWNADRKQRTLTVTGTVAGTSKTASLKLTVKAASITGVTANSDTKVTTASGTAPSLPSTATVAWSNGSFDNNVAITWDANDSYKKREGATYSLNGKVGDTGKTVTAQVTVTPATATKAASPATTTVVKGGALGSIPTSKVTWSNGDVTDENIVWDAGKNPSAANFDELGDQTFTGKAQGLPVTWKVTVVDAKVTKVYNPAAITVESGTEPQLPATVKADLDNGKKGQDVPVTWAAVPNTWKDRNGGSFEVKGVANGQSDQTVTIKVTVNPAKATGATFTDGTTETAVTTDSGTNPASKLPKTAKLAWSNGDTTNATITWESKDDYKNRAGGQYDLTGTAEGFKLTAHVTVNAATVTGIAQPQEVTVGEGVKPAIPATVKATWSNGDKSDETIVWNADADPNAASFETAGDQTFTGTAAGKAVTWKVTVVKATITGVDNATAETAAGKVPTLPATVNAHWSNGAADTQVAVTWNTNGVDFSNRSGADKTVKVLGSVEGWNGTVEADVTVHSATVTGAVVDGETTLTTPSGTDPSAEFPKNAKVSWSDGGSDTTEAIVWNTFTDYTKREGGTFDVKGTVEGQTVTLKVTVEPATPSNVEQSQFELTTTVGTKPELPAQINVVWSNGDKVPAAVEWEAYDAALINKAGTFEVQGKVGSEEFPVTATVTVKKAEAKPQPTTPKGDTTAKGDTANNTTTNTAKNKLSNTGTNVAIIAAAVVILAAIAVVVLTVAKRQRH